MPRTEIQIKELLTFDDVLLVPKYSEVLPTQVDVRSKFSRNIPLGIPIVSAAMDTVTEHRMAVAMALNGGIGVIHRNLSPEAQAEEVKRVKRFRAWMVVNPYTLSPKSTVGEAKNLMNSLGISGVPVVDERGRLLGLITKRDIYYSQNDLEPVTKYMTPKERLIVAKYPITLEEAKEILRKHRIEKLPVINENWELMGLRKKRTLMWMKWGGLGLLPP
jgi:IMP dehydrogenase